MSKYFSYFPAIKYNLGGPGSNSITVRNIFFRFKILDALRNNILIYYDYYVKDNETPEDIAVKYYKDVEKHWLVMLANDVVDGQFDWVLSYDNFQKYIENKYGGIPQAQEQIHHYEFTIDRTDSATGTMTNTTYNIDKFTYDNNTLVDVSKHLGIDFVLAQTPLGPQFVDDLTPISPIQTINLQDGTSVFITTQAKPINCYDFEDALNEKKRQIKLISREYLDQIQNEFVNLASN